MKPKAILLYSGGRDSSLVALLLKNFGYEVKLVTANAGIVPVAHRKPGKEKLKLQLLLSRSGNLDAQKF